MAKLANLSRARFYQLVQAGVFPAPARDADTSRPFYTEELQRACLEVRRRNVGVNGQPVVFYARRKPPSRARGRKAGRHEDLLDALRSLGLTAVTEAQVKGALTELFPRGTAAVDQAEVVRAVFLHLRRKQGR